MKLALIIFGFWILSAFCFAGGRVLDFTQKCHRRNGQVIWTNNFKGHCIINQTKGEE